MLPNTYQLLNYLESTGTQYIDTGLKGNLNTRFVASVNKATASTNNTFTIFGDNTTTGSAIELNVTMNTTGRLSRFGNKEWSSSVPWVFLNTIHKVEINKTGFYVDGYLRGSFNATSSFTTTNNLLLFKDNGVGDAYSDGTTRIYYAKIYDGDTLVRDYVPVKRIADDVVGMYDLANDVFYTNAGSGTFNYLHSQFVTEDIPLIPKMTSNTAPYGTVDSTGNYYDYRGRSYNYQAFDKINIPDGTPSQVTVQYMSESQSNGALEYVFANDVRISKISAWLNAYGKAYNYYLRIYDGSAWIDIGTGNLSNSGNIGAAGYVEVTANSVDGIAAKRVQLRSTTTKSSGNNLFASELSVYRTVKYGVSPYNSGIVSYELNNSQIVLTATSPNGYVFHHWENKQGQVVSYSNVYTLTTSADDDEVTACFVTVDLVYDNTLGEASYTDNLNGTITLNAEPDQNVQLLGWYVNSQLISDQLTYTYTVLADTTIEARFEPIYQITDSVDGNGAIQFTRGTDQNDVTFSVIPDANWHFVKYAIGTSEYTSTPLQLHLTQDISITAYFEEDDKFRISCPTGKNNISVYISDNDVYSGTVVTLWARPFPDYNFVRWGDGETTNPRQITVTENVTLTAEYQRVTDTNGIYQYRCFIKDQLNLTDPPKSFMVVDTFDVNVDLLTNATSSITVMEMPTNVNEGDVLVLYDPKGQFLYNGVITSIEDKTINCSQMQSFYNGSWVYQTSSKTYLEQEIATVLELYAQGKQKGSSYTDPLVAQRLGGITVDYVGSITSHLPTRWSGSGSQYEVINMEDFIYELYQKYSIVFDFEINFSGTNYVHIKVPNFSKVSVGNNMFAIKDMSPVTEIEETNRLIVYGSNNTYRKTYVATKSGIVEEPSSTANRFNITNTEIVFSDDTLADLVSANLPSTMYNHKLTFTLIIKNFIYEFGDFNLGGEMDVYYNDDYYGTVLTGYEITKESNQNITEAKFTCGKVRVALTKMLTMGVV